MNILKKLGIITGLGFAGISLIACNEEDTTTTPTSSPSIVESTKEEVILKKLKVVSNRNYEYALKGHEYVANVTVTGIYSNLEEVVLTDLVTFSSLDTSVVGNKSVTVSYEGVSADYTVKVIEPTVTNMVCAYSAIKLNYNVGDTYDSTGLYCYLYYEDDIREETKDYSITILDSNNNVYSSRTFNMTGLYTIRITYQTFQSEYPITVTDSSSNNINTNVNSITLDTTNVKTSYQAGEALSFDNLVVNGVTSNGNVILTDYSYEVYNSSNNLVTNTSSLAAGNYTVKIIYGSCSQFYNITVTSNQSDTFNLKLMISGAQYSDSDITLTRYESVDPLELVSDYIPSGYVFIGFGGLDEDFNWNCPNPNSDLEIKYYVVKSQTGKSVVSYVLENYSYLYFELYETSSNVTNLPKCSDYSASGYLIANWEVGNKLSPVTGDCYIFPNLAKFEGLISPTITTTSSGDVTIDLGLDNQTSYVYDVTLADSNNNSQSITSSVSTLSLTSGENYKIEGTVIYNTSTGFFAKKVSYQFTNTYYESLANISEDDIQIVSYANGMVVGTQEYVDASPEGYKLYSLCLYNEDNEKISETLYNEEFSLTFYGIEEGDYRIDAIYEQIDDVNTVSLCSIIMGDFSDPTLEYHIHFVGFWVHYHSSGDPLYKLTLYYDDEVLYTHYYAKGSYPQNVFTFVLPIKYDGYYVAGSLDYVSEINEDQDWELILVKRYSNEESYNVFFLGSDRQDIISYQIVSSEDEIIYPEDDLTYISTNGLYKYNFTGWSSPQLSTNTYFYSYFDRVIIDESTCQYEPVICVEPDTVYLTYTKTGKTFSNSSTFYIIGGNYLTLTKVGSGSITVSPNTTYTVTFEYSFKVDGDEVITRQKDVTFTTLTTNFVDESDDFVYVSTITYLSIYVSKKNSKVWNYYKWSNSNETKYTTYSSITLENHDAYLLTYFKENDDCIYYAYDNLEYSTLDIPYPSFDRVNFKEDEENYILYVQTEYAYDYSQEMQEIYIIFGNEYFGLEFDEQGNIHLICNLSVSFHYNDGRLEAYLRKYDYVSKEDSPDGQEHYYYNYYDFSSLYIVWRGSNAIMYNFYGEYFESYGFH